MRAVENCLIPFRSVTLRSRQGQTPALTQRGLESGDGDSGRVFCRAVLHG